MKKPTLSARVELLEGRMDAVENGLKRAVDNTSQILDIVKAGKGIGQFIRSNAPRVGSVVVGLLITQGIIDHELGAAIKSIFLW